MNHNQPNADLENLSYLNIDNLIAVDRRYSLSLGGGYYLQAFLFNGDYCICTDDFSQITYEGFEQYAYLSSEPKSITRIKAIEKKFNGKIIDHMKVALFPPSEYSPAVAL